MAMGSVRNYSLNNNIKNIRKIFAIKVFAFVKVVERQKIYFLLENKKYDALIGFIISSFLKSTNDENTDSILLLAQNYTYNISVFTFYERS
jgi:hypothetical protein